MLRPLHRSANVCSAHGRARQPAPRQGSLSILSFSPLGSRVEDGWYGRRMTTFSRLSYGLNRSSGRILPTERSPAARLVRRGPPRHRSRFRGFDRFRPSSRSRGARPFIRVIAPAADLPDAFDRRRSVAHSLGSAAAAERRVYTNSRRPRSRHAPYRAGRIRGRVPRIHQSAIHALLPSVFELASGEYRDGGLTRGPRGSPSIRRGPLLARRAHGAARPSSGSAAT